ncbi:class D beta-lactamase [Roseivirga sp.]|uniref:class D beta-lactamase n=1 Tax=Roseivirga sp. TaxID=1964215 RepID=UPI003B8BF3D4
MRIQFLLSVLVLFVSCSNEKSESKVNQWKEIPALQESIDSAKLKGVILIYDQSMEQYYTSSRLISKKGQLPASTFKIANSIIALELGVIESDSTLIKWDGTPRAMEAWEQDLLFAKAFQLSCVPCYQEIARKIGTKRMRNYLDQLVYGNIVFDSSTIDNFWLVGNSRISPLAQIDFISRLYNGDLSISERTEMLIKRMMVIDENDDYRLSGKTGWSIDQGNNNGWFVGYIESGDKPYFFATNVEPLADFDMNQFASIRKTITMNALRQLEIID